MFKHKDHPKNIVFIYIDGHIFMGENFRSHEFLKIVEERQRGICLGQNVHNFNIKIVILDRKKGDKIRYLKDEKSEFH